MFLRNNVQPVTIKTLKARSIAKIFFEGNILPVMANVATFDFSG